MLRFARVVFGIPTVLGFLAFPLGVVRAADPFQENVGPFLKKYCADCHSGDQPEGGVEFSKPTTLEAVKKDRKHWRKVFNLMELGTMPPEDAEPQPTKVERKAILDWLEAQLFTVDCGNVSDPGRVTIRRLNRTEYNNTIRDLLGVDFKPAEDFPSDDVGYGFDNIGDVLTLSPLLLEKYFDAAEEAAKLAILADPVPERHRFFGKELEKSGSASPAGRGFSLPSSGSVFKNFNFAFDGEYILKARAAGQSAAGVKAQMEVRLGGKKLKVFDVDDGRRSMKTYEIKLHIDAGAKKFEAAFINDFYDPAKKQDRNLFIGGLEIEGPFGAELDRNKLPEPHRKVVVAMPGEGMPANEAIRTVMRNFIQRAFRRPPTDEEVARFSRVALGAMEAGDSYEKAVRKGVTAVLVSPHFLFRIELDKNPDDPKAKRSLNDFELATRLSYFLWSSMPDEELFQLAARFELNDPKVLEQQVQRMLDDPRSAALVENFAGQWLNLGMLDAVTPDRKQFPEFQALRDDMRRETELFVTELIRENRSMLELLDGRYTYLNERLAKHYGIEGVQGNEFRRVALEGDQRAGVLTHASILTITSNPTRTSPVKRGKWILENILGTPPPEPPDQVPEFSEAQKASPNASLRKQLEIHRTNPGCASCHNTMDAIGFGFENFDAVGRWRDKDGEAPVDASGELPNGEKFSGPLELVAALKKNESEISRSIVEKMLTYALGRGLEYYDDCAVKQISRNHAAADYRFRALVLEIVKSEPFRMRRGDGDE